MFGELLSVGLIRSRRGHRELLPITKRGAGGGRKAARAGALGQGNCQLAERVLAVLWCKGLFETSDPGLIKTLSFLPIRNLDGSCESHVVSYRAFLQRTC